MLLLSVSYLNELLLTFRSCWPLSVPWPQEICATMASQPGDLEHGKGERDFLGYTLYVGRGSPYVGCFWPTAWVQGPLKMQAGWERLLAECHLPYCGKAGLCTRDFNNRRIPPGWIARCCG